MIARTRTALSIAALAGLAALQTPMVAHAAPTLEPPKLATGADAVYPAGAAGEATVELEMTIAPDGSVSDVKVVGSGGAGFDEAAVTAARGFVFTPALRDGKPVASRIRYRTVFTPPAPPPPPAVEVPEPAATPELEVKATVKPPAPLEFGATARIEAPPREATKRTIEAAELVRVAGTRGDVLRAVELMPGVARPPAGAGFVIVRGSSPADTEVQMEGVPVARLYHFGGLTSFVQGRLLDRIDLYPGNFSARYGRKTGGIIEVSVRDPKTDAFHAMADVNVIDASVLAEGAITNRLSLAVAAKRSYIDAFMGALASSGEIDIVAAPVYYDYQLLASWRPTDRDRVRAIVYGSADNFRLVLNKPSDNDPSIRGNLDQNTSFHRVQTQWRHRFSDAVEQELSVTAGPFEWGARIGEHLGYDVDGREVFARSEWRARLSQRLRLLAGVDAIVAWADITYSGPRVEQFEGKPDNQRPLAGRDVLTLNDSVLFPRPAAYAELAFQPIDSLLLLGGLRGDYYGETERATVDPRLVARYELRTGTAFKGGVGLFSQPAEYHEMLPEIGNPDLRPARAEHYTLGVEQKVGVLTMTLEGFHKRLRDLVVSGADGGLVNGGVGRIWGAEVSARARFGDRAFGLLSYTLSRSRRNDHGDEWRTFDWDQPHILTMSGSLRLGRGWELGSTFRYVSGNPMTPVAGSVYDANNDRYTARYGAVNSDRNDAFHQLDVRLEKVWRPQWGSIAAYLDVQNAYNRRNPEGRVHNYDFSESRAIPGLPVIPSLGVRGEL